MSNMKMTIDEAIPILHEMYNYYNDVDVDAYVGFDNEDNNAIETALETMRKYQKIEEAYKKYLNDMVTNIYADGKFIVALRGILEDGEV